jgi:hypothetical protein
MSSSISSMAAHASMSMVAEFAVFALSLFLLLFRPGYFGLRFCRFARSYCGCHYCCRYHFTYAGVGPLCCLPWRSSRTCSGLTCGSYNILRCVWYCIRPYTVLVTGGISQSITSTISRLPTITPFRDLVLLIASGRFSGHHSQLCVFLLRHVSAWTHSWK